jgi:pimeloyl-ACP methyl ester carboxylesterase
LDFADSLEQGGTMTSRLRVSAKAVWLILMLSVAGVTATSGQSANTSPPASSAIAPFKIAVPDSVLRDLKERLTRARFPEGIPGMNWNDGTDLAYLKDFVAYWRDRYDWRAQERRLNQFSQFTTVIDDIDIHFVHQRSKDPNAIPLLLLNGYPSSFVEYAKVIMPLVDPAAHGASGVQAFHVVVPAMPGFPFSGKRTTYGYTPDRIGRMWMSLMARLGYSHYAIAASDWGSQIAERVAMFDAEHVRAYYVQDMAPTGNMRGGVGAANGPARSRWLVSMSGPNSALPQTRGYGLSDSPVDLASWLLGSYRWLPDNGGNIESVYTKDELITNIMVYWVTNSGTSASRIYYETTVGPNGELLEFFSGHHPADPNWRITVPTGSAMYPGSRHPRYANDAERAAQQALAREHYTNIVYWSEPARGGHFAAEEQPQIWLDDVRKFFSVVASLAVSK